MAQACVDALVENPNGLYVDATFGGGGHAALILQKLDKGHLYGFDQDTDAAVNAETFSPERFTLIQANFRYIKQYLRFHGVRQVNGIMADFGVSSHQINEAQRGFSTRFEGPLDMRMDQNAPQTAADLLATSSEPELHKILGMYGEVRNARTLAQVLVQARINNKIETTSQLKAILEPLAPRGNSYQYFAQVFQALRIAVNDELKAIQDFLVQASDLLLPDGRLVLLSYHSLEDRLAKNFILKGKFDGSALEKDLYGNSFAPLRPLFRKAQTPEESEVVRNPRARSAKMRVGVKN